MREGRRKGEKRESLACGMPWSTALSQLIGLARSSCGQVPNPFVCLTLVTGDDDGYDNDEYAGVELHSSTEELAQYQIAPDSPEPSYQQVGELPGMGRTA